MLHVGITVDDVGLDGYSSTEHLEAILAFCAAEDLRCTFFVVPLVKGVPLTARPDYIRVLRRAIAAGHEVAQHGLAHYLFEVGVPPEMVLDLPHEAENRRRWQEEPDTILADLQLERILERLAQGRQILEAALEVRLEGFRAPALQWCEALPVALRAEGYRYDSSRYLQPAGWDLINGHEYVRPQPITRAAFDALQLPAGPVELPLTTDYTWYLTRDHAAPSWELALHDLDACLAAAVPFVTVTHVSPLFQGEDDCGVRLLHNLLGEVRARTDPAGQPLHVGPLSEIAAHLRGVEEHPI
jgi:peptidoglycan/xylan/chitin deacetylase (PgdA/CDA1 family)